MSSARRLSGTALVWWTESWGKFMSMAGVYQANRKSR